MQIFFRPIKHDPIEILMGQFIWFHPHGAVDAISVTANANGFTTHNRVWEFLGFPEEDMISAANFCNEKNDIFLLGNKKPYLLLVPQTHGQKNSSFLIKKLILICNVHSIKSLHFTHYGFIQKRLPELEVQHILNELIEPKNNVNIDLLIWDIDSRAVDTMQTLTKNLPLTCSYDFA